jgi:hypothetical protein
MHGPIPLIHTLLWCSHGLINVYVKVSFPKRNWPQNCVVHELCDRACSNRLHVGLLNVTYDRSANMKFPGGDCKVTVLSDVAPYNLVRICKCFGGLLSPAS